MPLPGHKPLATGNPHDLFSWIDTVIAPEGGLRPEALKAAQSGGKKGGKKGADKGGKSENFSPGSGSVTKRLDAIEKFLATLGEAPDAGSDDDVDEDVGEVSDEGSDEDVNKNEKRDDVELNQNTDPILVGAEEIGDTSESVAVNGPADDGRTDGAIGKGSQGKEPTFQTQKDGKTTVNSVTLNNPNG